MNIIIVEDNKIVRSEISRQINKIDLDIDILASFSNGEDALEYLKHHDVHLVISDIQMPIMNGLDLIKNINDLNIKTKVIFLSGYDDFKYVKPAFENGAADYILKPIILDECRQAILKAYDAYKNEIDEYNFNQHKLKPLMEEHLLRNLLFATATKEDINMVFDFFDIDYSSTYITVVNAKIKNHISDSNTNIVEILKEKFNLLSNDAVQIYHVVTSLDTISIIFVSEFNYVEITDIIINFKDDLYNNHNIIIYFGISSNKTLENLHLLYNEAANALNYTTFSSSNTIIQYDEIKMLEESVTFSGLFSKTKEIINSGNCDNIHVLLTDYLDDSKHFSQEYIKLFSYSLIQSLEMLLCEHDLSIENIAGSKIWQKIATFDSLERLKTWLYNITCASIDLLNQNNLSSTEKIIANIKKIIQAKYAEKITLDFIAKELHYSPKYLSNIFNKAENKSVYEYLTEYRVEIAKKLLKQPNSKIYQVAQEVGYTRKSHFYKIFKSYVGITPSEFKNNENDK